MRRECHVDGCPHEVTELAVVNVKPNLNRSMRRSNTLLVENWWLCQWHYDAVVDGCEMGAMGDIELIPENQWTNYE
jgi:hypothetical protein